MKRLLAEIAGYAAMTVFYLFFAIVVMLWWGGA